MSLIRHLDKKRLMFWELCFRLLFAFSIRYSILRVFFVIIFSFEGPLKIAVFCRPKRHKFLAKSSNNLQVILSKFLLLLHLFVLRVQALRSEDRV